MVTQMKVSKIKTTQTDVERPELFLRVFGYVCVLAISG